MPTRCNRWIFIADLIACSTCFGHHYAHHQELESTIQVVAACRIWCLVFKLSVWCGAEGCVSGHTTLSFTPYRQLENHPPNTTGSNHLYNTLELLMMAIRSAIKIHLLHLVGILFPHIFWYFTFAHIQILQVVHYWYEYVFITRLHMNFHAFPWSHVLPSPRPPLANPTCKRLGFQVNKLFFMSFPPVPLIFPSA